jgi:hypothetical protein
MGLKAKRIARSKLRNFVNIDEDLEKRLNYTLHVFELSNDDDVLKNLYKTEIPGFIKEFSRLKKAAIKYNVVWEYNPLPALKKNRFYRQ